MKNAFDILHVEARKLVRGREQPSWSSPMLATLARDAFSDSDCIFERKLDGERCLGFIRDGKCFQKHELSATHLSEVFMRPENLKTRIFLDGGDPDETREIIDLLGFLDGQTTNPTLISRNPDAKKRLKKGGKFTEEELLEFYRKVVVEISSLIPEGSVSVEVYADLETTSASMLMQGREMYSWTENAHIKFPTNAEGLKALSEAVASGLKTNMTLCFRQEQAAAVYAASRGCRGGDVYVSPFVGRLDDRGQNGMGLIANILRMYRAGDGHVQVLTASVRGYEHLQAAIAMGSDIVTAPFEVLKEWGGKGLPLPGKDYLYRSHDLEDILYLDLDLDREWEDYDIFHELTTKGIERFAEDWNSLLV